MVNEVIALADEKMKKTISVLSSDLSTLKAGRANPKMLDRIQVEYYGTPTPLSGVASIAVPEPRILLVTPWDKAALKDIERAILTSDLGINPNNDGSVIRLIIPELTEETRKDLVKKVKKFGEDAKIAIRSIRRDANDKLKNLKKENELTEDELKTKEDLVQKKTDAVVKEIDNIILEKEKSIMAI